MIKKRELIWNTISSVISSLISAVILAFCTRLNGVEIAGIFSICYATAYILNAIGDFGLRIFQVTDTNREYNFSEYLCSRIVAVLLMSVAAIIFVWVNGYDFEKLTICLLLVLFRVVENLSETYQAEFQINGRLELGGKSIVYRNILGLFGVFIVDYLTRNIVLALLSMVVINVVIFSLYDLKIVKKFTETKLKVDRKNVIKILKGCLPLAISTLISMYVINAIKYAIDSSGDYEMQTYFNIIYMPTFVINLISSFVLKPFLKPFGDAWNQGNYKRFVKIVLSIIGVLVGATIFVEIVCYMIGIPVLQLIYGVSLDMFKIHLLLLVLSGLLYAIANLFFNLLGTMRAQRTTTIVYAITAIFTLIIPKRIVNYYGMSGAVASNILIMGILFTLMMFFFIIVYLKNLKKNKKEFDL